MQRCCRPEYGRGALPETALKRHVKLGSWGTRRLKKIPPDLGFCREVGGFLLRGGGVGEEAFGGLRICPKFGEWE